ncbi:serine/threonine protein kinase [candidate division KSB1 bacterium]|nr:serine/threonine protein kinase [candidate division KSB1 bacterium]
MLLSIRLQALKYFIDFTVRAMPEPGSRLTITREISRSSISTVSEGYDTGLDRKVLVKSIHPQFARDSDLRARLDREARAIARISHPNVVQIFDLRVDGDDVALVLEFVEGMSLGKLLKDRAPLPTDIALTITLAVLEGLTTAHAAGIIHRDLKPDNVLVSNRGEVKITDFGMASLRDQPSVTMEGMVIGTPSYMAPEQASGAELTAATDLFAVGLMLFEMLTGERLIKGATLPEAYQNALKYSPPKLDDLREWIPEHVEPALRRLLERSADKRPQTALEAKQLLLRTLPNGPLPNALIADFLSGASIQRAAPGPAIRTMRSHRLLHTGLMALVGVVAIGVTVQTVRHLSVRERPAAGDPTTITDSLRQSPDPPRIAVADSVSPSVTETTRVRTGPPTPPDVNAPEKPLPDGQSPAVPTGPAIVAISTRPWAKVFLSDSLLGTTPLPRPLSLAAGSYNFVFLNSEIGLPIARTVQVSAGDTTSLDLNLYDFVARIRVASVKPWADVYVDDSFVVRTPSAQIIFRSLGSHRVTLKHPDYPAHTMDLQFGEGDPEAEIRFDFTQL